jgi:hypothetical protein
MRYGSSPVQGEYLLLTIGRDDNRIDLASMDRIYGLGLFGELVLERLDLGPQVIDLGLQSLLSCGLALIGGHLFPSLSALSFDAISDPRMTFSRSDVSPTSFLGGSGSFLSNVGVARIRPYLGRLRLPIRR